MTILTNLKTDVEGIYAKWNKTEKGKYCVDLKKIKQTSKYNKNEETDTENKQWLQEIRGTNYSVSNKLLIQGYIV